MGKPFPTLNAPRPAPSIGNMKTYSYTEQPERSPRRRAWTRALLILMGLGFALFCLVNFMVFYPTVRVIGDMRAEVAHLTAIKANVVKLGAEREGGYEGLNQSTANQARVFPATMNDGDFSPNAEVSSRWGGRVHLRGVQDESENGLYVIEYHAVPLETCLGLVSGAANTFEQIRIGGSPVFLNDAGEEAAANAGGKFDAGKAAGACVRDNTPPLVEFVGR